MTSSTNTPNNQSISNFREGGRRSVLIAFCLGVAIITIAIILGRSFVFPIFFLSLSIIITLLWRKADRPWVSLVSMSAASPLSIGRQQFNCNLVFALWSLFFTPRYLFRLPKWIYLPSCLAILGAITSMGNWMSDDLIGNMLTQGAFLYNFFIGPFLLLPVIYLRMKESRNHEANLQGLLFFLIIPSTLILISAKLFGTVANWWKASQHVLSLSEGFLMYKLGNAYINFLRTEVGFILAALICASTAIAISQVKGQYRWLAGGCLVMNVFLLLSTASFGSGIACFLGLVVIFQSQIHKIGFGKVFTSMIIILMTMVLSYALAPSSTKTYLEKRFEHRVTNTDTDRFVLWQGGVVAFLEHPEGVGLTLKGAGDRFIHNDYIVYAVSYGFFGGLGYAILIVGLLLSFLKVRKKLSKDPAALAVYLAGIGVLVALAANSITDHSNENRWYFNVIWSIIWYCYFCSFPEEKKKSAPVPLSERGSLESPRSN